MINSLCIVGRKALLNEQKMNLIANNLANLETLGYKEDKWQFHIQGPQEEIQGRGFAAHPFKKATWINLSPGPYRQTGNVLDLAIHGDGFFCVESPEGTLYTRKGNFALDRQNRLVTQDGLPVLGEGGDIVITGTDVKVDVDGNVYSDGDLVGRLRIAYFEDKAVLEKTQGAMFRLRDPQDRDKEKRPENLEIWQGYVEGSNVEVIPMLTEMISSLRAHESYKNAMEAIREAERQSANQVGLMR